MIGLLLAAQLAASDSTYSSQALRELIARAAEQNRIVPAALHSYHARVESEIAIVGRRIDGAEGVFSVEQVQNDVHWRRNGAYEQRVTGYRSQSLGLSFSMLGFFRQAWTIPVLYGNRLSLFFGRDTTRGRERGMFSRQRRPTLAVHPLADDRERRYRYVGGDTIVTLQVRERSIPIVRVLVEPRTDGVTAATVVFRGEVDLDAVRHQIVRMRGYFLTLGRQRTLRERLLLAPLQAIAYVELVNAEFEGKYWLPSYQRFEAQASFPTFGDSRSVFRIVSRFRAHALNDSPIATTGDDVSDTLRALPHRLTFAPRDSIGGFSDWAEELGAATGAVHADDFDDVAPDVWRTTGRPRFGIRAQRFAEFFHYNRVEGAYTGLAAELRMRDAAPGVSVRASGGWAWSEETMRGRLAAEWARGRWVPGLRVARSLDITNDFRDPLDSGTTLGALIWSIDDYDYVDRRSATVSLMRRFGGRRAARLRLEGGVASDRYPEARLTFGPWFHGDSMFRPNRGVAEGRYLRSAAMLEVNPDVSAELMRPGAGATVTYERGDGDLDWQRIDVRLVGRRNWRAVTYAARFDAGALFSGEPPPQQLFELGQDQNLPGYEYKEFAGDRAAVLRGLAMFNLGIWGTPNRVWGRYYMPGIAPALYAALQGGWTKASDSAAHRSIRLLGSTADTIGRPAMPGSGVPVSRPTDGIRTSVELGVRFFGGALGMGYARPVDRRAPWKFLVSWAQVL